MKPPIGGRYIKKHPYVIFHAIFPTIPEWMPGLAQASQFSLGFPKCPSVQSGDTREGKKLEANVDALRIVSES